MQFRQWILMTGLTLALIFTGERIAAQGTNNIGQVLKININLQRFIGKPSWLLIIRDVDHNQNIPYLFDITNNQDYFLAFTYGRNYYIVVSEMVINPFDKKISNFCGLESMGAIQRGISMDIIIGGMLTKNPNLVTCQVLKYSDPNFNINSQD